MGKIMQKIPILAIGSVITLASTLLMPAAPVLAADPTTSVTITRYDTDGVTVLDQETVDYEWMEANLPVLGNGITHYYHQGPTFDTDNMWDPDEEVNWESRDYGAVIGTDIKDLCDLVGGASSGDVIQISSPDGFNKKFDYEDVYDPEPEQGKMVLTWYTENGVETGDGYVPDYSTGMRLVFFAETKNGDGEYVFGNWDMHETLAEERWHYYYDGTMWPSSSGLSVKWVSDIKIYTSVSEERASDSLTATAYVYLNSIGISLNRDAIDFGEIRPGESSDIETVVITNTGNIDVYVTLEVLGDDDTAQSFYEQSLYIDDTIYDIENIIVSILVEDSEDVDTQLKVPSTWNEAGGEQEATFIFWAEASSQS
ncbi:MAG: hypothetical protein PHI12_09610 [Dehalococcoidales bacterium]|nr:hypothetical protein [Dehalococcoidales bacterium]